MGKAGQIAANIAATFCSTGIPAGFSNEDYAKRHYGGYLGVKSRKKERNKQ